MEDLLLNSENEPPGLYFSKALFEGLIFGGAIKVYEGKFAFQKRLGYLACSGEEIYHFCFVFTLYSRANFKYIKLPGWA